MLLDFLFPKTCFVCGRWKKYVCDKCEKALEFIRKDPCIYCWRINQAGLIHDRCKRPFSYDGSLSFIYYNSVAKNIIKNIKYKLVKDAFEEVFTIMWKVNSRKFIEFKKEFPSCQLQAIPLHTDRKRKRGFNQAEVITAFFSKKLGYPTINVIRRQKNTAPQAKTHNRVERSQNIKNAFSVINKDIVVGKNIILVDDVMTTGSTAREATRVLKKAGANSIFVFSLAHG